MAVPRFQGECNADACKHAPGKVMTDEEKFPPENNLPAGYVPPKVWTWESESGGTFANINRPIAGPTHDKELPAGKHPHQLYLSYQQHHLNQLSYL